jgi:hypothetical protein
MPINLLSKLLNTTEGAEKWRQIGWWILYFNFNAARGMPARIEYYKSALCYASVVYMSLRFGIHVFSVGSLSNTVSVDSKLVHSLIAWFWISSWSSCLI